MLHITATSCILKQKYPWQPQNIVIPVKEASTSFIVLLSPCLIYPRQWQVKLSIFSFPNIELSNFWQPTLKASVVIHQVGQPPSRSAMGCVYSTQSLNQLPAFATQKIKHLFLIEDDTKNILNLVLVKMLLVSQTSTIEILCKKLFA